MVNIYMCQNVLRDKENGEGERVQVAKVGEAERKLEKIGLEGLKL